VLASGEQTPQSFIDLKAALWRWSITITVLSIRRDSPYGATNSITHPTAVVAVESALSDLASHTVPGYTIQVLELKAQ
jgi:hypothetical protein